MDIKDYIKTITIQKVNVVRMLIEINTNNLCRKDGWTYVNNSDFDSEILDVDYNENIKLISDFEYREYNTDAIVGFIFVNINNKELKDFKELVDCIGQYIYDIRVGKYEINTTKEVNQWLHDNLEELIVKYR